MAAVLTSVLRPEGTLMRRRLLLLVALMCWFAIALVPAAAQARAPDEPRPASTGALFDPGASTAPTRSSAQAPTSSRRPPRLGQCTANPSLPGCDRVLPTLAECVANPALVGCGVVLPALATCIAAPATPGCSVVLPSLATCIASPQTAGCSVVLPSLATCIAAPATAGCSVVLPLL